MKRPFEATKTISPCESKDISTTFVSNMVKLRSKYVPFKEYR
jgi:hypothetical protein